MDCDELSAARDLLEYNQIHLFVRQGKELSLQAEEGTIIIKPVLEGGEPMLEISVYSDEQ